MMSSAGSVLAQNIKTPSAKEQNFVPFLESGKWGFRNSENRIVVEPIFDSVGVFEDGLAEVIFDQKYYFINTEGKFIKEKLANNVNSGSTVIQRKAAEKPPLYRVSSTTSVCFPNFDFEQGDFTNWETNKGRVSDDRINRNFITQSGWIKGLNDDDRHTLMDRLTDPPPDKYGGFPVNHPRGGRYSLKLGSERNDFSTGRPNALTESVRYEITVPNNDFALLISYAVVFENPRNGICNSSHCSHEQPRFKAAIYKPGGDTLQCFNFTFVADDPLPGFQSSLLTGNYGSLVRYRPWTDVFINLSKYRNTKVYLEITAADCTLTGHWGYGYFDVIECDYKLQLQNSCNANNSVLNGPDGPFKSYTWWDQNFTKNYGTGQNLLVNPALPDDTKLNLIIEPYDGYGCRDTIPAVLSKPIPPSFKLGPTQPNCGNVGVLIGIPPKNNYTYEWTPSTGLSSTNTSQVTAKPSTQTKYKLKVTDNQTGCSTVDSTVVSPYPAVRFRIDPQQTCINVPVLLEAKPSSFSANYTYSWKPSTWLNTTTGSKVTSRPLDRIEYLVTGKDVNTGCTDTVRAIVDIRTSLQISGRAVNPFDCNAKKGTIILSGFAPNRIYPINYTKNGQVIPASSYISNAQGEIEMTNLDIGTYSNIYVDVNNCTSNSIGPFVIFAPDVPLKPFTPVKKFEYCSGQLTNEVQFVSTDNTIFGWTNTNTAIGLSATGLGEIAPFIAKNNSTSPIEAMVIVRAFLNGCPGAPDTVKFIVNPLPKITATGGEACEGSGVVLKASGADEYVWSPLSGLNNSTGSSVTATPTSSTTYTVVGKTNATGCSSSATAVVKINPTPAASLLKTGTNFICQNDQFTMQLTGIQPPGTVIQWLFNGQPIAGANGISYPANKEGVYTAALTTPQGCKNAASGSVDLQYFRKPKADFIVPAGCIGASLFFQNRSDLTQSGLVSYEWDFGNGKKSTEPNPVVIYDKAGTYNVTLRVVSQKCADLKDSLTARVLIQEPLPGIRYPRIEALENTPISLEARSIGNAFLWLPSTGLNNATIRTPVFNYDKDVEYLIRISRPDGCLTVDTIQLRVHSNAQILVPDAFSPNGDGTNDYLDIFILGVKKIHFWVFNRWGQLMFETTDPKQRWDGRFQGKPQPLENYVWIAEGETYSGKIIRKRGQTILVR
jgi:gliding motility-associated-like protein